MTRERFGFRVYDEEADKFLYETDLRLTCDSKGFMLTPKKGAFSVFCTDDLEFFTGAVDENGKKVYEHDVVVVKDAFCDEYVEGEVYWSDYERDFVVEDLIVKDIADNRNTSLVVVDYEKRRDTKGVK